MIEIRKPNRMPSILLAPVTPDPDVRYIPSQFALSFVHKEKTYVFHTLTKHCIKGRIPEMVRGGGEYDDLIRAHFLVPEDMDECAWYLHVARLIRACLPKKGLRAYTIMPTLQCNARCVYCYEEGLEQTSMTLETAKQVIRYIADTHGVPEIQIQWNGGEPLLGEKAIDRICEGLRETGIRYRSSMITNGSLITPQIIRKMKNDWNIGDVQISVDGAEEEYIARKRYITYHDYYHKAIEDAELLARAGIRVNVHCGVDEENLEGTSRFLEDLAQGTTSKENITVQFFPMYSIRCGENDLDFWKKILAVRPLIEKAGLRYRTMMFDQLDFHPHHCRATSGSGTIFPDGSLYACAAAASVKEGRLGDIWHGITDEVVFRRYCRAETPRDKCRTCPFLPRCTPFDACPIEPFHCREVYTLLTQELLGEWIERGNV